MKFIAMVVHTEPRYKVTKNGLYFSGKVKNLLAELRDLSKQYHTLRDVINQTMH
ncbi:hypothetical protein SCACP_19180 [Sporomusa carbonis]|uniref:hypothetical protein n=1 Tax=Sporomusa carbonis TaxID=3076075 RepID=UPI003A7A9983